MAVTPHLDPGTIAGCSTSASTATNRVHIGVDERRHRADTGVVEQDRDILARGNEFFDPGEVVVLTEVGDVDLDRATGLGGEPRGQALKALFVTRDEDEVVDRRPNYR